MRNDFLSLQIQITDSWRRTSICCSHVASQFKLQLFWLFASFMQIFPDNPERFQFYGNNWNASQLHFDENILWVAGCREVGLQFDLISAWVYKISLPKIVNKLHLKIFSGRIDMTGGRIQDFSCTSEHSDIQKLYKADRIMSIMSLRTINYLYVLIFIPYIFYFNNDDYHSTCKPKWLQDFTSCSDCQRPKIAQIAKFA